MTVDPVLVVGAGPVGLAAASFLAHFGTPVRIIDSNACPTTLSKALVLWRRSTLTLEPLIPFNNWYKVGVPGAGVYFGEEGGIIGEIEFTNPSSTPAEVIAREGRAHALPPAIMVSQADVEDTLCQYLQAKHGIKVERCTSLSAFKVADDGGSLQCTLTNPQGNSEEVTASFLIGADGARSVVRKSLGLSFGGVSLEQRWLLADCKFEVQDGINPNKPHHPAERAPVEDKLFATTSSDGVVGLIPVAGRKGLVRIIWYAAHGGPPGQPTLEDFQAVLLAQTRQQIRLTEALWLSEFKINERQVDSYVHHNGRVLLAGDAAHVHSPVGGQGMNTGIQDAANLAWKVALVAAGEARDAQQLLKTYEEERWSVGASVIRMSGILLRANTIRNFYWRMLRAMFVRVLFRFSAVRARMVSALAEDTIAYPTSSLTRAAPPAAGAAAAAKPLTQTASNVWNTCKPGTGLPDVSININGEVRPATDLLHSEPGRFGTLVLMSEAPQQQGWPTHWGHWQLHRVQVGQSGTGAKLHEGVQDNFGLLTATVGGRRDVGVLVRPDGIVGAVGNPAQLQAWLSSHTSC